MLSQMGMMIILALSYNMLLGQAGLFSLCHATLFGFGGYCDGAFPQRRRRRHAAGADGVDAAAGRASPAWPWRSCSATWRRKQRATAFAMITLGIGELMATAALMFHHFFGGEGGVTTDRMIDHSLFGLTYASGIQVYYLILAWTLIATLGDVLA